MWREDLHPRDEYGRFRERGGVTGAAGIYDRLAGAAANQQHARNIAEYEALWQKQFNLYQPAQARGELTPEMDAQWDRDIERRDALNRLIPEAHRRGLVPHDDGTWRQPGQSFPIYDEQGRRLPLAVLLGWRRVGDSQSDRTYPGDSPLAGGYWHPPGRMLTGGIPRLYRDDTTPVDRGEVRNLAGLDAEDTLSVRDRRNRGALLRAELRAERPASRVGATSISRREFRRSSPDVVGGELINALNPTSRRRTARQQRNRQQNVTWVQRLNAQIEGR